jgi:hypothetical protein
MFEIDFYGLMKARQEVERLSHHPKLNANKDFPAQNG